MTVSPPEYTEPPTIAERLIDRWHGLTEDAYYYGSTLAEFLNLTEEEFAAVYLDPKKLDAIVRERNPGFATYIEDRLASKVTTLQSALATLDFKEKDDGTIVYDEPEETVITKDYCTGHLNKILEFSELLAGDEGWNFDGYHNLRLAIESYEIVIAELDHRAKESS